MSLSTDGVWKADVWATTVWGQDVWFEGAAVVSPSGGWKPRWGFKYSYEEHLLRSRVEAEKRLLREEEAEQISDEVTREIAEFLREQEAQQERDAELEILLEFSRQYKEATASRLMGQRVGKAYERAARQGNRSAVEALERELARASEEEEFLMIAMMMVM